MFLRSAFLFLGLFLSLASFCQQQISGADAVIMAIKNNKNVSASDLVIKQQKQLLKSSINLPNPEVFVESPTGNFYTGSVTQSIEFPAVYRNQYRLQKGEIALAQKEKQLTEADLKYKVSLLYLEMQFTDSLVKQLYMQDTLYEKVKRSAIRQFTAGQIDYLQQIFAETQYGEIHNQYEQAITRAKSLKSQMQWYTGLKEDFKVQPFEIAVFGQPTYFLPDSAALQSNPYVQILQQQQLNAQQNIALQKSKALPGLAFGYFNQGERDTKWFNRFRFGFTIPLWYGQYKSQVAAAKTAQEVLQSRQQGLEQDLGLQAINTGSEIQTNWQLLQYYQQTGVPKAREIISTSQRFFASGEIDYISLLRTGNDAYAIYLKYLEAIKNYNQSVLNYQYLMGQL